mmetsp:Transcript_26310/g.62465  ORF Transcript_26310/g.62465 Transcript_26310/m.62465 type:complete len:288 (+) Transcript_26310:467-1330(+)
MSSSPDAPRSISRLSRAERALLLAGSWSSSRCRRARAASGRWSARSRLASAVAACVLVASALSTASKASRAWARLLRASSRRPRSNSPTSLPSGLASTAWMACKAASKRRWRSSWSISVASGASWGVVRASSRSCFRPSSTCPLAMRATAKAMRASRCCGSVATARINNCSALAASPPREAAAAASTRASAGAGSRLSRGCRVRRLLSASPRRSCVWASSMRGRSASGAAATALPSRSAARSSAPLRDSIAPTSKSRSAFSGERFSKPSPSSWAWANWPRSSFSQAL